MSTMPPEGRGDGLPSDVVVPDTIEELEHDILALRREQRAVRRQAFIARFPRLGTRSGAFMPVVLAFLVITAIIGGLLVLDTSRAAPVSPPLPARATPSAGVGAVGGWLPTDSLLTSSGAVPTSSIRTALIAVIPANCTTCTAAARNLVAQAHLQDVEVLFVAGTTDISQADSLAALDPDIATSATDQNGALVSAYDPAPGSLTVVSVRSDGLIAAVVKRFSATDQLVVSVAIAPGPAASS